MFDYDTCDYFSFEFFITINLQIVIRRNWLGDVFGPRFAVRSGLQVDGPVSEHVSLLSLRTAHLFIKGLSARQSGQYGL